MNKHEKYLDDLRKYYNEKSEVYASTYSGEGRYPSNTYRLNLVKGMLAGPSETGAVLEAGCGDAPVVCELRNSGYDCVGFDFSEEMIRIGKDKLEKFGDNPEVIKIGDIFNIPYEDNSFNTVLCLGVLPVLPDHDKIFKEFQRVLKPNGSVVFQVSNELFSLFTFNKHSISFLEDLFKYMEIPEKVIQNTSLQIAEWLNVEDVKLTKKSMSVAEVDRTIIDVEKYNPLNLPEKLKSRNMILEDIQYYHFHPLPPRFENEYPELFSDHVQKFEGLNSNWRAAFVCNTMVVSARFL